jgi:hypothetical protein
MGKLIYELEALPPYNSDYMKGLAKHLWDKKEYWHWSRRPLEDVWEECDQAYLCYRELPISEGMPWIDQSDFGETDIFDGVNQLSMTLSLALMPKDESWLTVVGQETEDPMLIKSIEAHQIHLHRKARTRRMFARHLKQLIVRGTSAIFWRWDTEVYYHQLSNIEALVRLGKELGIPPNEVKLISKVREERVGFNGPRIRPLDVYDLFLDPEADIVCDRQIGSLVQTYRRLSDLVRERKEDGSVEGTLVYGNLLASKGADSDIVPWRAEDVYSSDTDGQKRLQSLNTMGIFPQNAVNSGSKLVPVYIFHLPYLEYEGKEFFDTYFHIAISREGNAPRMILVEQNPSIQGHRSLIVDNYIDWFTNHAYGIGAVEKLISGYKQLGVLSSILLQAMVVSQFPPMVMQGGVAREDQGINMAPGAITEIALSGLGLDFIKPIPTPERGVQLGLQDTRWYKEKIAGGFGNMGAFQSDPNRSISTRETATSVNFRAASAGGTTDEQSEKFNDSLQELCQGVYDMSRQMLEPDPSGQLPFERMTTGGQMVKQGVDAEQFDTDRSIQVLGQDGIRNRQQEIENLYKSLEVIGGTQMALPNAPVLMQQVSFSLLTKLGVEIPPEAELSPMELAAMNPQVQQAALAMAMQNPEIQAALGGGNGGQPQNGNGQPSAARPKRAPGGNGGNPGP